MMKYVITVLFALVMTACGNTTALDPSPIDEEIDVCETCYMMVPDNQFAAQFIPTDGDVFKFDDIGCMAIYMNENQLEGQSYTRDFYTNEWIEVDQAIFVAANDVETPMNYGYISFGNQESLEKYLGGSNGNEMTWSDVLIKMKELDGDEQTKHSHN